MSVIVATAYMEEAARFDCPDRDERRPRAGDRLARRTAGSRPGPHTLDDAFIAPVAGSKRRGQARSR